MIKKECEKKYLYHCRNCNSIIPNELLEKFIKNPKSPICEYCGAKIFIKENYSNLQRIQHDLPKDLNLIDIFRNDDRFNVTFKGNLVIALSLIIYIKIKSIANKRNLTIRQIELANTFKRGLAEHLLSEIITKELINREYVRWLNQIQLNEFNNCYQDFRLVLGEDKIYAEGFCQYLQWLIGNVYDIGSGDLSKLTHFENILVNMLNEFAKTSVYSPKKAESIKNPMENNSKLQKQTNIITFALSKDRSRVRHLSKEVRNAIIGYVYSLLMEESSIHNDLVSMIKQGIKNNAGWTKSIPTRIFADFKSRIESKKAQTPFQNYLTSLTKIILRLIDLDSKFKDLKIPLSIRQFARDLSKEKLSFGINVNSLSEIVDHLKSQFSSFTLERLKGGSKLYIDSSHKLKECGNCHEIKPYSEFSSRGPPSSGKLLSSCKKCNLIKSNILRYLKKYEVIKTIFGEVKCLNPTCELESDIIFLPSLNFHHTEPKRKKIRWSKIYMRSIDYIISSLSNEDVIVLCDNCHIRVDKNLFNEYKDIILDKNLFYLTPKDIKKLIKNANKRQNVEYWFKKRYIIEQLFESKCVGCGKIHVENNLPALTFHHRDPKIKDESWAKSLRFLEMDKIIEKIKEEDIICLCANCHRFLYSTQFIQNYNKIFSKIGLNNSIIEKLGNILEKLLKNIKSYKIKLIKFDYPF